MLLNYVSSSSERKRPEWHNREKWMSICLEQIVPFPLKIQKARIYGLANTEWKEFNGKQFYEGFCHIVHSATVYMRSCLTKVSALKIFTVFKLVCTYYFLIWLIHIIFGLLRSADLLKCRSNLRFRFWFVCFWNNQLIKRSFYAVK